MAIQADKKSLEASSKKVKLRVCRRLEVSFRNMSLIIFFVLLSLAAAASYICMRVTLTRNVNKAIGFVNGMTAEVLGVRGHVIVARTRNGSILTIFPFTDTEVEVQGMKRQCTYLPLRLGYATTLVKVQGATLEQVVFWLDVANVPAAGYVALSRVQRDADWKFIGHVTPHHFTPAVGV